MLHRNEVTATGTIDKTPIIPLGSIVVIKHTNGQEYPRMLVRGGNSSARLVHLKSGNIWGVDAADVYVRDTPDSMEMGIKLEDLEKIINGDSGPLEWQLVKDVTIARKD
jgi:hypothetical protein